jgi:hypothetical protein
MARLALWASQLAAVAMLAACSTPYQEMGFSGGVMATQIDATTVRVHARGNGFTDPATIQDYVMLKAAEETQRLGYDLFQVMDEKDTVKTEYSQMPGTATSYTTAYGGFATTSTYYSPGATLSFDKPRSEILIKLFRGPKPAIAPPNLFAASEVIQFVGTRVEGNHAVPQTNAAARSASAPEALPPTLSCYVGQTKIPTKPDDCQKLGGIMR